MNIILEIIILIGLSIRIDTRDLEIMGSGLKNLKKGDMLLRFYITLYHHGEKARNVFATMIECCEKISENDLDCESIRLHDDYIRIPPGTSRNLTLIYPNIYIYDRKGSCLVSIWHRISRQEKTDDKPVEIRHRITFDTTVKTGSNKINPAMKDYYDPKIVSRCVTKDLDPFDSCNPVTCYLKYSGNRNYYNSKYKRCQKVPICIGDPRKELVDIVYVPSTNMCRDLEKIVSEADIANIIRGNLLKQELELDSSLVNIQCHHGEIDVRTGLCICDYGWKSEPFNPEYVSTVYHMCNIPCNKSRSNTFSILPLSIGLVLAVWTSLCVCICEKRHFACQFLKKVSSCSQEECACLQT